MSFGYKFTTFILNQHTVIQLFKLLSTRVLTSLRRKKRRRGKINKMHFSLSLSLLAVCCVAVISAQTAESQQKLQLQALPVLENIPQEEGTGLVRDKRTLFLKKKLLGAGLLGFGLGLVKGVKAAGYHSAPEVHHVYLSPPAPQVKYVEYVEKPVFVERIVEKPVHIEYEPAPQWSQPAPSYGPW